MSTISRRPPPSQAEKASFKYGWRLVRQQGRDGREEWVRIPLTLRDVLHPQSGDVHVLSDPHTDDCTFFEPSSRSDTPTSARSRS
jgi:hypothetical protein